MNRLSLGLINVAGNTHSLSRDILLENVKYVQLIVDGCSLIEQDARFEDSIIVWPELLASLKQSGSYLIFTSINGIADDGGWQYVDVKHCEHTIEWSLMRDEQCIYFIFERDLYNAELIAFSLLLEKSDNELALLPTHVIFPEK